MPRPTNSVLNEREALFRQGLRRCTDCEETKPLAAFGKYERGRDGLQAKCKECINRKGREYARNYAQNPEWLQKQRERARRSWHQLTPEQKRTRERKYALKKLYGLTPEQFDELMEAQQGRCALCKEPFDKTPHVDHDHATGKVRGLLHTNCNTALGSFRDSPEILRLAIEYLQAA